MVRLDDSLYHLVIRDLARRPRPFVTAYVIDLYLGLVRGKSEIAAALPEHFEPLAQHAHRLFVGLGIEIARQKRGFVQLGELVDNYLRIGYPVLGVQRQVRRTIIIVGQLHDQERPRLRSAWQRHPVERQRLFTRQRPALKTEFNIEGYPSKEFIELVVRVKPEQVTLVPDAPDAITSSAGWDVEANMEFLSEVVDTLREAGIRSSIFIHPDPKQVIAAAKAGADRVELYTKPYADGYAANREAAVAPYVAAAVQARKSGIGVNAGHDLSLDNLGYFAERVSHLSEVSIGHALICEALYLGFEETIKRYRSLLK